MSNLSELSKTLRRCQCGSVVYIKYEPGCTYIHCNGCAKTVASLDEWQPETLAKQWNEGGEE